MGMHDTTGHNNHNILHKISHALVKKNHIYKIKRNNFNTHCIQVPFKPNLLLLAVAFLACRWHDVGAGLKLLPLQVAVG